MSDYNIGIVIACFQLCLNEPNKHRPLALDLRSKLKIIIPSINMVEVNEHDNLIIVDGFEIKYKVHYKVTRK